MSSRAETLLGETSRSGFGSCSSPTLGLGSSSSPTRPSSKWGWCLREGHGQSLQGPLQASLNRNMALHLSRPLTSPTVAHPMTANAADHMFAVRSGALSKLPRLTGTLATTSELYGSRHFDAEPVDETWKTKASLRTKSD